MGLTRIASGVAWNCTVGWSFSCTNLPASTNLTVLALAEFGCPNNSILAVGGICSCIVGFYESGNICPQCPSVCTACTSATNCIDCISEYVLGSGMCMLPNISLTRESTTILNRIVVRVYFNAPATITAPLDTAFKITLDNKATSGF